MQTQDSSSLKPSHRVRISAQSWEQLRPVVQNLYCTQGKTLKDTRKILEDEHGLKVSEKTCKERIQAWGFRKNNTRSKRKRSGDDCESGRSGGRMGISKGMSKSGLSRMIERTPPISDEFAIHLTQTLEPTEFQIHLLPKSLRLTWQGHNVKDLNNIMSQGRALECQAMGGFAKGEVLQKYRQAEALYRKAYAGYESLLGPKEQTWKAARSIAHVCNLQGEPGKAEALLLGNAIQVIESYGEASHRALECLEDYARNLSLQGRLLDSEIILGRIMDAYEFERIPQSGAKGELDRCRRRMLLYVDVHLAGGDINSNAVVKLDMKDRMTRSAEILFELLDMYIAFQLSEDPSFSELKTKLLVLYFGQPHPELDHRSTAFLLHQLTETHALSSTLHLQIASKILQLLQTYFQENHKLADLSRLLDSQKSLIEMVIGGLDVEANMWSAVTFGQCTAKSFHCLKRYDESNRCYEIIQERILAGGKPLDDYDARNLWPVSGFVGGKMA